MSHRPGGEAEKNSNFYEDNVLIHYYGQMLDGKYLSVMSESFNRTLESGGDIYLRDDDNQLTVVQVKSRHGNDDSWSVDTLISIGIIKNACYHISQGRNYVLVSPLSFIFLRDLCRHALAFNSYVDFRKEFITKDNSQDFIKLENEITKYFNGDDIIHFYKKFFLKMIDDDLEKFIIDFQNNIKAVDGGYKAFQLLRHYAIRNNKLSQEIYADELWKYLSDNGVKKYVIDEPNATRQMHDLCSEYKINISRKLINKKSYKRNEFTELIKKIDNENVVIIHGKAGAGKSGLVYQLCEYFDEKNELYLPVSLDARMPNGSAHEFGKQLGLSASPILTLSKIANKRIGYLIIDQLDAIRWSVTNSTSAFAVCCELVKEAIYYGNVKLIFVCRTIDAEKVLRFFEGGMPKLSDCSVDVGPLKDSDIREIIGGNAYSLLSPNLKKMLYNINNLRMFMELSDGAHIEKASDIIREYINKKLREIQDADCSEVQARRLLQFMVNKMRNRNTQMIPYYEIEKEFGNNLLERFCSCGISEEINSNIRFAHQSILDYFFAIELDQEINRCGNVVKIISKYNNTAIKDYEVLKQYFEFVENNSNDYSGLMRAVLFSKRICSFIRHIALESFKTTMHDDPDTISLALRILMCKKYGKKYLYYLTINNHVFLQAYIKTDAFSELKKSSAQTDKITVVNLLFYASGLNDGYLSQIQDYLNYIQWDENVLTHLYYQIDDINSSDRMFDLKIELLSKIPSRASHLYWESILSLSPSRASKYIEYIFKNNLDYETHYSLDNSLSQLIEVVQQDPNRFLNCAKDYLIANCSEWDLAGYNDFRYSFAKNMAQKLLEIALNFSQQDEYYNLLYSPHALLRNIALKHLANSSSTESLIIFKHLIDDEYIKTLDFRRHKVQLGYLHDIIKNKCTELDQLHFDCLIKQIKLYKSPRLLEFAKDRFEQRKRGYFYHFFEEEQKVLLCAIPIDMMDESTREYVKYLYRKFPEAEYYYNFSDSMVSVARSVVSGIAKKWHKFSIKTWEQILINPKTGNRSRGDNEIDDDGNYVEYDRGSFCRAISMAAGIKQTLFVKLALSLDNIPRDFVDAICSGLSENENSILQRWSSVENIEICDTSTRLDVYKKYFDISDKRFLQSFIHFIENNKLHDSWIDAKLVEIAQNPDKYETEVMNVWRHNWDKKLESLTTHDLDIEKINRVQTCAITALANTLLDKKSLDPSIKDIINDCYDSSHPVLLLSAVDLIYPIWNFDKQYTIDMFTKIVNKDLRVLCGFMSVQLLDHFVVKYSENFHDILSQAIEAGGNYLETIGARIPYYYCYYNIFGDLTKEVLKAKPELILSCCTEVIKKDNDIEKQNRAKKLLLSLKPKTTRSTSPHSIIDIILNGENSEKFSISILKKMMPLKQHEWYGFLSDLNEVNCLSKRSKLIFSLCNMVTYQSALSSYEVKMLVDVIVKLYAELYDQDDHIKLKRCLNKLNKIYDTFVMDTLYVANKMY
ncbi:MAG: hypothetical protein J1F33_01235 [Clostridiales bacterium]|nr:hypothetical protein [Clostridiales bacterium]